MSNIGNQNLIDKFTKTIGRPPSHHELGKLMKMQADQEQRKQEIRKNKKQPKPKKITRTERINLLTVKVSEQKEEIARLKKLIAQLHREKTKLLSDLEWRNGENHETT